MDSTSKPVTTLNGAIIRESTAPAQETDMHHLASVAISASTSKPCVRVGVPVQSPMSRLQEEPPFFRQVQPVEGGLRSPNLIRDDNFLNHDNSENFVQADTETSYMSQLRSLAKIPASRLGKGGTGVADGDGQTSVFPPAFTVVLGGIPPNLAHRLFSSPNSTRIFSQPTTALPATPSAAAVIAAPPSPNKNGSLFLPANNVTVGNLPKPTTNPQSSVILPVSSTSHIVSVVADGVALPEVDESSSAVAELTSEETTVNMEQNEPFEEINDSIHISTA
ncbi:unnamed protein product [Mesocestoides corti]|uniref:Flocculation protein FLO11-like n=1 Tax=Mesocestoides corti TaxID=53468 RepID=A0A0R3UNM9_MESCO|nr:unnamed protein product [Mesocestoides corti]